MEEPSAREYPYQDIETSERLIRIGDLIEITGLSRTTIYREIQNGRFPVPIRIGASVRWPMSEISQFIESRKAERGAPYPGGVDTLQKKVAGNG
jgi:prophage regulatory protein